ncbi:MAG: adenylosuccinate synthase [Bacteroidetes bacterium]|nr:adenylosuccinate synthase [Bacteroidota bacterium]
MGVDVILGLQWGDEGKGKIVDLLSSQYDIIARFQGGPNAGHTIIIGDKKFVLHQIPSGITRSGVMNVIGNAVVLDPTILLKEITALEAEGIEVRSRLLVSRKSNLILPGHRLIDAWQEESNANGGVGSTKKGIGPTYQDKTGRFGLRIGDLHAANFDQLYNKAKERHLRLLRAVGFADEIDDAAWLIAADEVRRTLTTVDSEIYINEALNAGKRILAEGAQGTLLDIDFGTYPFVTSSNTVTASACTGLGISPKKIGKVYGVFKAYSTRVGEGPFPTELLDETGEMIRKKGHEFGSTTGRPRRCGWLDMDALKYAIMLNGVDELFMMKIDVLSGMDSLSIGEAYNNNSFAGLSFNKDVTVNYTQMQGWQEEIRGTTDYNKLPDAAKTYISQIEKLAGLPISLISTGPEREEGIRK